MKNICFLFFLSIFNLYQNLYSEPPSQFELQTYVENQIAQVSGELPIDKLQQPVLFVTKQDGKDWIVYKIAKIPFLEEAENLNDAKSLFIITQIYSPYKTIQWDDGSLGQAYSNVWRVDIIDIGNKKYLSKGLSFRNDPTDKISGNTRDFYAPDPIVVYQSYMSANLKNSTDNGFPLPGPKAEVTSVSISPDGKTIGAISLDWHLRLWDSTSGKILWDLDIETGSSPLAFSPDGKHLAYFDSELIQWDYRVGTQFSAYKPSKPNMHCSSIVYSPDGTLVAIGNYGGTIQIFAAKTGILKQTIEIGNLITSLSYNPTGNILAVGIGSGSKYIIELLDTGTGETIKTLAKTPYGNEKVQFFDNGKYIGALVGNNQFTAWEVATGQKLATLMGTESIASLAVSPDGLLVALGRWDGKIELWNLKEQKLTSLLSGHTDLVRTLFFHPEGGALVSGSKDGSAYYWLLKK